MPQYIRRQQFRKTTVTRNFCNDIVNVGGWVSPCAVSPLWCFPPAVSSWGSVWVGLTPTMIYLLQHSMTVTRGLSAIPGPLPDRVWPPARAPACPITTPSDPAVPGRPPVQHQSTSARVDFLLLERKTRACSYIHT